MPYDLLECLTPWCSVEPSAPAEATPKAKETSEFCFCSQKTLPSSTFVQYFQASSCCRQNDCHGKCRARFSLFSDSKSKKHWKKLNLRKDRIKKTISKLQRSLAQKKCHSGLVRQKVPCNLVFGWMDFLYSSFTNNHSLVLGSTQ